MIMKKLLKTGKDVGFAIFTTDKPEDAKKLIGLKLAKLTIANTHHDCSTLLDAFKTLHEVPNKKLLKILLTGLYVDTEALQILRTAAISGAHLECKIALDTNFAIQGKFAISDFEIECQADNLVHFTFALINAGKYQHIS
jgi:predicted secreted protein